MGALGLNEYKFSLDLYEQFDSDAIKTMKTDSKIDIFIPKLKNGFWPRLVIIFRLNFNEIYSNSLNLKISIADLSAAEAKLFENRF